ncbi:hypothetical protein [Sabulicella rubraurantiaca]|uniref:hypothetical protein n=1 Tax=Sabulicella rubraurantiaca TaxID=2811429 RepID=UPI001A962595|nr:hypothetical protein [Sabulicella rubraurantiaca]
MSGFADLRARFAGRAGAGTKRGFGRDSLTVGGRIFALPDGDSLVLKLPAPLVDALVESGTGVPWDAHRGRALREWVALGPGTAARWPELAEEAWRAGGGA